MLDVVDAAAGVFQRAVEGLTEDALSEPSALPGWSRRHVIAHVALNADGFVTAAHRHRDGEPAYMYPGGAAARDREIGQLAAGPTPALFRWLDTARAEFSVAWSGEIAEYPCATAPGHPWFSSTTVLLRRLRELQVHLVDLGLDGVGPHVWEESFVVADLPLQWSTVAHRSAQPVCVIDELGRVWNSGPATSATPTVRVDRRLLLAWVLDRATITDLPPLEPWMNRSRWEHLIEP